MKILTCNVRTARARDGENAWHLRAASCAEAIAGEKADLIGFQEMTGEQLEYLARALPGYARVTALDGPAVGDPVDTILYREDAFALRGSGAFWLSETPHVPGSRSWHSDCVRMACWAHLVERRSGRELRIVNTHLDHISQGAREHQARLLSEDAAAYPPGFVQILTGDMNADRSNPCIASFLASGWTDTYASVHGDREPGPTYHAFRGPAGPPEPGKIDWIFARGEIDVESAEIIRDRVDGRYPSDHYFLSATVEWR